MKFIWLEEFSQSCHFKLKNLAELHLSIWYYEAIFLSRMFFFATSFKTIISLRNKVINYKIVNISTEGGDKIIVLPKTSGNYINY